MFVNFSHMTDIHMDPSDDDHSGHVQPEQMALFVNLDGFEGPIDLAPTGTRTET